MRASIQPVLGFGRRCSGVIDCLRIFVIPRHTRFEVSQTFYALFMWVILRWERIDSVDNGLPHRSKETAALMGGFFVSSKP